MAARYRDNPTVMALDIRNEPKRTATWASGNPATDWNEAAVRGANAILAVNPDVLIFVEGVQVRGIRGVVKGVRGIRGVRCVVRGGRGVKGGITTVFSEPL